MAIWKCLDDRACGVFLHISSLPSKQGIGCFGRSAYDFINFLKSSGMKYWQICPLNPTSFGDSPYQSPASFAYNPYFIDLEALIKLEWLDISHLEILEKLPNNNVDYGKLYEKIFSILKVAHNNFEQFSKKFPNYEIEFREFCKRSEWWVDDYARFMALKEKFSNQIWTNWPEEFSNYEHSKSLINSDKALIRSMNFYKFVQWICHDQWTKLKTFTNGNGIFIIGDLPIFVGFDSADVWSNRKIFKLHNNGNPKVVAGVPPDAFSKDGQLWGNPVYDWMTIKNNRFSWWNHRIRRSQEMYDVIRIDHFRGFCDYWEIPANEKTAINGKWKKSVGIEFFNHMNKLFPNIKFIAENLGDLNDDVWKLLEDTELPGMNVLHFAFDGDIKNKYLPHEHDKNSILYLGTHDNDTTIGWFHSLPKDRRSQILSYFNIDDGDVAWDLIKKSYGSPARLLILNMQDILNLGSEARFNTPNTTIGNWTWRMNEQHLQRLYDFKTPEYLKSLAKIFGR